MGLLLSVLVACVGAIELLDFYCNVRRRLELVVHDCGTKKPPRIELNRDFLSREEIEVECAPTILRGRSKSPRRFLVTEREGDRSRSPSPRRFIVTSEETPGQNLPEFLITEHIQGDNNLGRKFILVDPNQQKREKSPLPLPKQFIVSESEHSLKDLKCREAIDIQINSLSLEKKSFVDQLSSSNDDATIQKQSNSKQDNLLQELLKERYYDSLCSLEAPGTSAGQPKSFDELVQNSAEEDIEVFHRCPSPYPALELPQRKENICRLANQATTSMLEVDEDSYRSRSPTPEKIDVILHSTTFNTTEYWTNKILIEPPVRNKSESTQSLDAPLGELVREKMEKSRSNDGFLNSLDGVEGKNLSRGGTSRRSFKKKGHRTLGEKSGDTSSTSECNQTKQIDSNESKELTNKPVDSDWVNV